MSYIKYFLGVDPGVSGSTVLLAYQTWAGNKVIVSVYDHKEAKFPIEKVTADNFRLICKTKIELAVVESVHAMPGQGVTSMFSFGKSFGAVLAILEFARIKYQLVTPRKWMHNVIPSNMPLPKRKEKSIELAKKKFLQAEKFLTLKKHHGRSDAMHLASYACDRWLAHRLAEES